MTESLFGLPALDAELHTCDLCPAVALAPRDTLRVSGWVVFDGTSETGKELHVRICAACQRRGKRS